VPAYPLETEETVFGTMIALFYNPWHMVLGTPVHAPPAPKSLELLTE